MFPAVQAVPSIIVPPVPVLRDTVREVVKVLKKETEKADDIASVLRRRRGRRRVGVR